MTDTQLDTIRIIRKVVQESGNKLTLHCIKPDCQSPNISSETGTVYRINKRHNRKPEFHEVLKNWTVSKEELSDDKLLLAKLKTF